ncbi:hypothetical protein [Allorhizobium ampelinum]|nr:hypothetical protein [Allorhizobium ampelinum]
MTSRGYGGPLRYIQGPGVIDEIGLYIAPLSHSALIVIDGFFWDTLRPDV